MGDSRSRGNDIGPTGITVGENIRRIRGEQSFTQADMAKNLAENGHPIPVASIGRIESGDRRVEVDDLMAIAIVLGVSPLALLLPMTRGPRDTVDITGWGSELARGAWGYSLGISEIADVPGDEPDIMSRSFPLWVEQMLRRWAAPPPEPDDIFHPYGD